MTPVKKLAGNAQRNKIQSSLLVRKKSELNHNMKMAATNTSCIVNTIALVLFDNWFKGFIFFSNLHFGYPITGAVHDSRSRKYEWSFFWQQIYTSWNRVCDLSCFANTIILFNHKPTYGKEISPANIISKLSTKRVVAKSWIQFM